MGWSPNAPPRRPRGRSRHRRLRRRPRGRRCLPARPPRPPPRRPRLRPRIFQAGDGDRLRAALLLDDIAAGAPQPWLLGRLLGAAFRAHRRQLGQVVETRAAGDANPLGAEFGLRHRVASPGICRRARPCHRIAPACQTRRAAGKARAQGSGLTHRARSLLAAPAAPLAGTTRVPGDKSICHRALMFGALAVGETRIAGLLEGEDVLRTAAAMRALGAEVAQDAPGAWRVAGRGVGGLVGAGGRARHGQFRHRRPAAHRHPGQPSVFLGDDRRRQPAQAADAARHRPAGGLRRAFLRPRRRAAAARDRGRARAAAAGLRGAGAVGAGEVGGAAVRPERARASTRMEEPEATRDHSENMLRHFGATVHGGDAGPGGSSRLPASRELRAADVVVPGDPSSAAFPIVAALLVPGSRLRIDGGRPQSAAHRAVRHAARDGRRHRGRERARRGRRAGRRHRRTHVRRCAAVDVPAERAPSMIDEFPILAVAAAFAEGTTRMRGLTELRVKESDRLTATAALLGGQRRAGGDRGRRPDRAWTGARPPAGRGRDAHGPPAGDERPGAGAGHARRRWRSTTPSFIDTSFPGFRRAAERPGARPRPRSPRMTR